MNVTEVGDQLHVELPPPFYLNQSRWKTYQDCDRMYGWNYLEQIEPDRPRKPLAFGSAMHRAIVVAHTGDAKKNIAPGTKEAFSLATEMAVEDFRKSMSSIPVKLPGDEAEIQEGVEVMKDLLPGYFRTYASQSALWKPLGMELQFCVEVGEETNVFLVGTIDNLVTFQGNLWLVDYKTMGRLDLRDFLKYEIDIQLTAYIYGGTKQLSLDARAQGRPPVMIRGAIIDGMVKTKPAQYHREMFTRSIDDLREFELEFCQKSWEIAAKHAIVRQDRSAFDLYMDKIYSLGQAGWKTTFPKNTQQCFRYGTCAYRDLCVRDNETRRLSYRRRDDDYVDKKRLSFIEVNAGGQES